MKNWIFIITVVSFSTVCSAAGWSLENRAIINPIGSSTVPPSSIQSGFINNPNPIDTSGNLIITGNVRLGRHFRGTVPYQSTTNFRAGLGSSSLSSFLRDSAGVEDFGRYAGKYRTQPYYSRSRTVTTTTPGRPGVFRPTGTAINNRTSQSRLPAGIYGTGSEKQALPGVGSSVWDSGLQGPQTPLEITSYNELSGFQRRFLTGQTQYSTSGKSRQIVHSIRELQLLNQRNAGIRQQDQQLMVERYQKQTQDTRLQTQETRLQTQETRFQTQETSIVFKPGPAVPGLEQKQSQAVEIAQPAEQNLAPDELASMQANIVTSGLTLQDELTGLEQVSQADEAEPGQGDGNQQDGSDILEQVRQQLTDLIKSVNETQLSETSLSQRQQIKEAREYTRTLPSRKELSFNKTIVSAEQSIRPLYDLKGLSRADLSARAKRIRGPYGSSESYSEAKFNRHFQSAEEHLKAGRYYAAADCFALASIYKQYPGEAGSDPVQAGGLALCFAGRGHALFAAGEYISSALFLSRALELAPEYARTKIDLAALLGSQNKLESRIAEIKEWMGRSGSGKLEFLLSYVYYRTGKLNQAKQAIEAASQKMSQSLAVDTIKKAIDDAIVGK